MHKKIKAKITSNKHINKYSLSVFVLLFVVVGGYFIINSFAASTPVSAANLWMDADGGSCTYSSSQVGYNSSTACPDFNTACSKVPAGATLVIPVKGGTYTGSKTSLSNCKPTGKITFQVVSGEKASTTTMTVTDTNNVQIDGMYINISNNGNGAGSFFVCTQNITLSNVEIEGDHSQGTSYGDAVQVWPRDDAGKAQCHNQNFKLDHVFIHDLHTYVPAEDNHTDCVQAASSNGLTITNSRLVNCGTQSFQLNDDAWPCSNISGCASLSNVVLENNWVGTGGTIGGLTNFTARNNVFINAPNFNPSYMKGTKVFTGNILDLPQSYHCGVYSSQGVSSSVTFKYNIANVDCPAGTNSIKVTNLSSLFVNASTTNSSTWDLHLSGNNAAVGAMPFNLAPASDYDGDARPQVGNVDVGADQYNSTPTPSGSTANIWVDGDGGNCTYSSTATTYVDSASCDSFASAYSKAPLTGTTIVRVKPKTGGYPTQSIPYRSGATANTSRTDGVQFIADGTVNINYLEQSGVSVANHVKGIGFDGFIFDSGFETKHVDDWQVINSEINGGVYLEESHDVLMNKNKHQPANGAATGTFTNGDMIDLYQQGTDPGNSNITVSNSIFHGLRAANASDHPDAIQLNQIDGSANGMQSNIVLRSNVFYDNECMNLRTDPLDTIYVINNYFGQVASGLTGCNYYSMDVWEANATVMYNTFEQTVQVNSSFNATQSWIGNLGPGMSTACGVTNAANVMKYNVWTDQKCSASDKQATSLGFVGGASYPAKLHITPSSQAFRVSTDITNGLAQATCSSSSPLLDVSKDFDGDDRPQGVACDAGADEAILPGGPVPPVKVGDTNNDGLVNIVDLSTLLSHYNTNYTNADFNKDNIVNITDLSILLSNFGK